MRVIFIGFLAAAAVLHAQGNDNWKMLDFLIGEWTADASAKDTPHGAGRGEFSFQPDLQRRILVRRNHAGYDSGNQHDDLMVIYLDPPNGAPHAIYFDTEGHVIRYSLAFPSAGRVVFETDATQPGPRYRLTYWMDGSALNGRFEIAAPAGDYKTYLSWTSHKKGR